MLQNRLLRFTSPVKALFSFLGTGFFILIAACGGGGGSGTNPPPATTVAAVEVSPSSVTIAKNSSQQFSALARDANGNPVPGVTFTWSSDNPNIASVDANGLVLGMAEGSATITASTGGLSRAATIQVTFRIFTSPTLYPLGAAPTAVAAGDFNHDGFIDLAIANADGNSLSLLKGASSGVFSAAQTFPVGLFPQSLVKGRFDNNLYDDLAVANVGNSTISIFAGVPEGLGPISDVPTTGPISIVAADFNGDNLLDLATASTFTPDLSILLGNGLGGFSSSPPISTEQQQNTSNISLLAPDLDRNGKPDLVAVVSSSGNTGKIVVLVNNGNGGFMDPLSFPVGGSPNNIVSGDWNADGIVDVAVVNSGSANLTLLFGNGTGGFSVETRTITLGGRPEFAAVGDFNRDGKPDIAVSNSANDIVSILLNAGSGLFAGPIQYPTGKRPLGLIATDLNGDGKDDLAVTNSDDNTLSVFFQVNPG